MQHVACWIITSTKGNITWGRGVLWVCKADTGRVAGQEHTGFEREQGVHFQQRKEPSRKGSRPRQRPVLQK